MATLIEDPLRGTGIVFADGERVGKADYEIIFMRDDNPSAYGELRGNGSMLQKAFYAKKAELRLDSGERLIVTLIELGTDTAPIEVTDPPSLALVEALVSNRD